MYIINSYCISCRKGGSSSSSSSSTGSSSSSNGGGIGGGGWSKPGGSSSSNNGLGGGSSGFGKPGKGKPSKGKWVKKAVIGAGAAYTAYKVKKAKKKFGKRKTKKGKKSYEFEEWDTWRQDNGILCRDNDDCWLDERLTCNDYALVRADINHGWFGGDTIAIRGTCQCDDYSWWDDDDLSCALFSGAKQILPIPLLALASVYFCLV